MRIITKHNCQANSWWMKAAAKFATAGFTAVHSGAETCIMYVKQQRYIYTRNGGLMANFIFNRFFQLRKRSRNLMCEKQEEVKNLPMTGFLVPIVFAVHVIVCFYSARIKIPILIIKKKCFFDFSGGGGGGGRTNFHSLDCEILLKPHPPPILAYHFFFREKLFPPLLSPKPPRGPSQPHRRDPRCLPPPRGFLAAVECEPPLTSLPAGHLLNHLSCNHVVAA
jgi:hypothetical protein